MTAAVTARTTPLRVGVNLLWLVPGVVGGSEEYTTRLLRGLAEDLPPDLHLTLFALRSFADAHPDLVAAYPTVTARLDGRRKAERVAAEATWLAREAGRRNIELLHHAGGVVPPGPAVGRIPAALTIHDLQPLVMPENFSSVKRRWLTTMLPSALNTAYDTRPILDEILKLPLVGLGDKTISEPGKSSSLRSVISSLVSGSSMAFSGANEAGAVIFSQ